MHSRKLILAILLFVPFFANCQSIDETLSYINPKLKKYDYAAYIFKEGYRREGTSKALEIIKNSSDIYYHLSINDRGKLKIERLKNKNNKKKPIMEVSVYIKQLKDTVILKEDDYLEDYDPAQELTLKCKQELIYCMEKHSFLRVYENRTIPEEKKSLYKFTFSLHNHSIAKRISKAISHLIKLGHKKEDYYESDPFKN